jgi:hypothetical protein
MADLLLPTNTFWRQALPRWCPPPEVGPLPAFLINLSLNNQILNYLGINISPHAACGLDLAFQQLIIKIIYNYCHQK